jgi:hypothetical protein
MQMARRLGLLPLVGLLFVAAPSPWFLMRTARAADLDAQGEADAKEATRLYKQGQYDDAAKIYAKLSVDYPDMPVFERNVGACFYYLHKPEPALSNLRNYLNHKKDIAPDDKAVVDRWIDEMEKLLAQNRVASSRPPAPVTTSPVLPRADETTRAAPPTKEVGADPRPSPSAAAEPIGTASVSPASTAMPPASFPPSAALAGPTTQTAGVNLDSAPSSSDTADGSPPYYRRWWFWGGIGAAVAAGVVTAVVLSTEKGASNTPATDLGNRGAFQ